MVVDFLFCKILSFDKKYISVLVNESWAYKLIWYGPQNLVLNKNYQIFIYAWWCNNQIKNFGFATLTDRDLFAAMLETPGVGFKTIHKLIIHNSLAQIRNAISKWDFEWFTTQKIPYFSEAKIEVFITYIHKQIFQTTSDLVYNKHTVSQLKQLGYKFTDIMQAIQAVPYEKQWNNYMKKLLSYLSENNLREIYESPK